MIFAAGIGSRLKPFTLHHPKALAEVAGKPVLQHAMEHLHDNAGISRMVVNVHHFADQIISFLKVSPYAGDIDVSVSDESERLLDTGGGLLAALPLLETNIGTYDDIVVLHNADIVTDVDISSIINELITTDADAVLLMSHRDSSRHLWFDKNSRLVGWENVNTHSLKPCSFIPDMGLHKFGAFGGIHAIRLSRLAPHLREYGLIYGNVFSLIPFYLAIIGKADIRAYFPEGKYHWFDIGTPDKLAACNKSFIPR